MIIRNFLNVYSQRILLLDLHDGHTDSSETSDQHILSSSATESKRGVKQQALFLVSCLSHIVDHP